MGYAKSYGVHALAELSALFYCKFDIYEYYGNL